MPDMTNRSNTTFNELLHELQEATELFDEAQRAESFARSNRCEAVNRLNEAQRAFDKAVAEMKGKAPRDSDWTRHQLEAKRA